MVLNNHHSLPHSIPIFYLFYNYYNHDFQLYATTNKSNEKFEGTNGVIRIRINRRRTDNTMTKRKRTNNDLQSIHIKLKIEQHELN